MVFNSMSNKVDTRDGHGGPVLASSSGHSQILSHSCGEKTIFLHGYKIKPRSEARPGSW